MTDPDLVLPGWTVEVPVQVAPARPAVEQQPVEQAPSVQPASNTSIATNQSSASCTAGFFLLTCQSKRHQRAFIRRNKAIHRAIRDDGIRAVVEGKSSVTVTGAPILEGPDHRLRGYLFEATLPNVWLIYLLTVGSLALEALLLS